MFISEITHSALVVTGELAARKSFPGISSKQIAHENNIPQGIIDLAVIRLFDMGFVLIKDERGTDIAYSNGAYLHLAKHPDEIYVADVIKQFNKDGFGGSYIDANGEALPQSNLTCCINHLRWRGEQFVETQMRGMSINVLAAWSRLKKGVSIEQVSNLK